MALLHSISDAFSGWLLMLLVGLMAGKASHDSRGAPRLFLNLAEVFQLLSSWSRGSGRRHRHRCPLADRHEGGHLPRGLLVQPRALLLDVQ